MSALRFSGGSDALYVATPTGVAATDTAAIQAAVDLAATTGSAPLVRGGRKVKLHAGIYVVSGLTWRSLVHLLGEGQGTTTIKLADGANTDVIKGANFDALTGLNGNAGIYGWSIEDLTIDGNKANNTSGRGIAVYGYEPRLKNVEITNCAGLAVFSEWGATSAVSSDTLALGSMEGKCDNLKIHRNDGGGIDWVGPSDSMFSKVTVAKNGPSSGTTTVGIKVRGNAVTCQFSDCHVWGTPHKYGWQLDVAAMLSNCESEGAVTSNYWLRAGGNQISNGKSYTGGAAVGSGLTIGDTAGSLFSGDNVIQMKFKDCGVEIQKDSGGSVYDLSYFWADGAKTFITNTGAQNTVRPNVWRVQPQPVDSAHAAVGAINSVANVAASVNDAKRYSRARWAPTGWIAENMPRAGAGTDCTGMPTSGKLNVVGGITLPAGVPANNIVFWSGSIALAGSPVSNLWFAMWDASTLALLGVTANDAGLTWAAESEKSLALSAAYTPSIDQDVYVGYCVQGTTVTVPSMRGIFIGNAAMSTKPPALAIFPVISTLTNPASAPNPLVLGGATYTTKMAYAGVS